MINAGCTLVLWFGVGLGVAATASAAEQYRPVVLMHGLDASASSMSRVKEWVEADYPGIHVNNVEVGNGKLDSWFMPIDKQVGAIGGGFAIISKSSSSVRWCWSEGTR